LKGLLKNEIKNATLVAATENVNYPATNLIHQFLKLKYKCLGIYDSITVTFPNNIIMDCFFYGYSNASSMVVELFSNTSVLLDTITIDCTYSSGSKFFTKYTNVRKIIVYATSIATEDLYIGGIACGESTIFPMPVSDFDKTYSSNSKSDSSTDGQIAYQYINPIIKYPLKFKGVLATSYRIIAEKILDNTDGHFWIDITEDLHSMYQPLYCTIKINEVPRSRNKVSFSLDVTEAK